MFSVWLRLRSTFSFLTAIALVVVFAATAAWAINSEGDMFSRSRMVGNLGVAHADVGVYPDRADVNPAPARTGGTDTLSIPAGAEVVEAVVYWAGRGPGWAQPSIVVNGVTVAADTEYSWTGPGWDQTTYVADLSAAGVTFAPGDNTVDISGFDVTDVPHRTYGAGVVVVYDDPSLPEVELELFEGNDFAFFRDAFSDDVGETAEHTNVSCIEFEPSIEDRTISSFSRIMAVDAGRGDGPPRTQRIQWWQGTAPVVAPVVDGIVGIPATTPSGSVDNPVAAKVDANSSWGSAVYEAEVTLSAGNTHLCTQVQSISLGDGAGASLTLTNQGGSTETVHRLGDLVWLDANDDGMADADESGIEGVVVDLFKDGEPIASTTTGPDGDYEFVGLLCGTYTVVVSGDQDGLLVDGEPIDAASIMPGSVSNPNANDDNDNDNNGVVSGDMVMSGEVEIGDCGEDGDFSNAASNEPTDETNRKGGDDADPNGGDIPDERSNASVDIAFVENPCVADADGNFPPGAVNADGEPCSPCDLADAGPGATDADGNPCDPCGENAAPDATDADGNPCDPVTVEVDGTVECAEGTDKAGEAVAPGEPCDDVCDEDGNVVGADTAGATSENCQETQIPDDAGVIEVEVEGTVECAEGTDKAGETVATGESCDIEVEVLQETENAPNLAVTGGWSLLAILAALMVVVLGAWFYVAGLWFRPVGTRR